MDHKEVRKYFETVPLETAEIVLELVTGIVGGRQAKASKISANLKRARAAKGTAKVAAPAATASTAAHRGPGRPRHTGEPAARVSEQAQPAESVEVTA